MGDLKLNGATSGTITLTPTAVAGTNTITLPASTGTVVVSNSSGNASVTGDFTVGGTLTASGALVPSSSFKRNRIINGNMLIDQRNAGASVTPTVGVYTLDRWVLNVSAASKVSVQQNAGSVTPPVGFTNYAGLTSTSAYTVASGDYISFGHTIEGFNVADLGWGTANAKTITVSFWVRSSLTGTFGGVIQNGGFSRSYPFTYTISSANTWEQKTITIAGDTTGTWATNNTAGMILVFGIGVGSTYSGTAGAWAATNYTSATGATNIVATSGATWYITGVQLEVGTKATPYEMQIYSDQLAQCQRYYVDSNPGSSTAAYTNAQYSPSGAGWPIGTISLSVTMRAAPTISTRNVALTNASSLAIGSVFPNYFYGSVTVGGAGSYIVSLNYTASAEL